MRVISSPERGAVLDCPDPVNAFISSCPDLIPEHPRLLAPRPHKPKRGAGSSTAHAPFICCSQTCTSSMPSEIRGVGLRPLAARGADASCELRRSRDGRS